MTKERFKIITFVSVMLRVGEEVLLIRRCNTNIDDGLYGFVGGGVDGNESVTNAAMREVLEEVGVRLEKDSLKVIHVQHKMHLGGYESICFFTEATKWEGEPRNMEPNKCDDLKWFSLNALPKNMQSFDVVEMVREGIFFSESGW